MSMILKDPVEFAGLGRGLGEAVVWGLDALVTTRVEVVGPAPHAATRRAAKAAVAAFTVRQYDGSRLRKVPGPPQPLTVTVALPWVTLRPSTPTNSHRRS